MRTDHYALKFLLDQWLSTVPQYQWVSKLFGFDFTIEYRRGTLNVVADALSRREMDYLVLHAITEPSFQLFDDLRRELQLDDDLRALHDSIVAKHGEPWRLADGLIMRGARVFVPAMSLVLPPFSSWCTVLAMKAHRRRCSSFVRSL